LKKSVNTNNKIISTVNVILLALTMNCYANPVFKQTVDSYLNKANNAANQLLALLGVSSSLFLTAPTGSKIEMKFTKADGTPYADSVVDSSVEGGASIRFEKKEPKITKSTNYTDAEGKVTIFFNVLEKNYTIEIKNRSGVLLAKVSVFIPRNATTGMNLNPNVEFGDVAVAVLSATPVGGSVPSNLNYTSSPFIFTINLDIGNIVPLVSGPVTSCKSNPELPSGLRLGQFDCALSGTPTTTQGPIRYRIAASNAVGSTETEIVITINYSAPASLVYSGSPFIFTINSPVAEIFPSFVSTITSCTSSPSLPTGLILSQTNCAVSGTPTVIASTLSYTITASNLYGSTSTTIVITVNDNPPSSLTYSGSPFTFTQTIPISMVIPSYSGTITACNASPPLPEGIFINPSDCAITGTPSASQGATSYDITASNAYGSTTTTISIAVNIAPPSLLSYGGSSFTFTQNAAISNLVPTYSGSISTCTISPSIPAGLSINSSNCTISGTPTGVQASTNYTVTATNISGSTQANFSITINNAPPSSLVFTGSPYTFTQNLLISPITPTVVGTVTSCTSSPALPTGLGLNPSNCILSGTPTAVQGAVGYTITASNISGSTTANITITVQIAAPSGLSYAGSPFTFVNSTTITTQTPTYTGTVTSCSIYPSLPTGLSFNTATCAISGTPTVSQGATNYTVTASNSTGSTTVGITITINTPSCVVGTGIIGLCLLQ